MSFYSFAYHQLLKRHFFAITGPNRVLPDFLIIGAKRCGTTSLFTNLPEHPSITSSHHDNMGFFNDNFHLGVNWYRSFFTTKSHKRKIEKKIGECLSFDTTTTYMENRTTAENVKKIKSDMKIIVMLRNPIDRAYSQFNRTKKDNVEVGKFEDIIKEEINELVNEKNSFKIARNKSNYIKKGIYYEQLKPWFELFPRENIGIFPTEEFKIDSKKIYNEIFDFLNLPLFTIKNNRIMEKGDYSPMKKELRDYLSDFYKEHNEKLFKLIGKEFEWDT